MGKKSAPDAPDPVATAQAQSQLNKDSAIAQSELNMIDQFTPYGSLTYEQIMPEFDQAGYDSALQKYNSNRQSQGASPGFGGGAQPGGTRTIADILRGGGSNGGGAVGFGMQAPNRDDFYGAGTSSGVPRYRATQSLSPEGQEILDLKNKALIEYGNIGNEQLTKVRDALSTPVDFSSLGDAPVYDDAFRDSRYDAIIGRTADDWNQDLQRMETKLYNQGLNPGSEAWNRGIDDYHRSYNDYKIGADSYADREAMNRYSQQLAGRNQSINEMLSQRSVPLNEIAALTTGQQIQNPNFVNTPQASIASPDLLGATYASHNINSQNAQSGMGGLYGLGGSMIGGGLFDGLGGLFGGGGGGIPALDLTQQWG